MVDKDRDQYLHVDGKPVIFVYDGKSNGVRDYAKRWSNGIEKSGTNWYSVLKLAGGHDNVDSKYQPDSWHQYGTGGDDLIDDFKTFKSGGKTVECSVNFSPGSKYCDPRKRDNWRPYNGVRSFSMWEKNLDKANRSSCKFQLIVSFNEWCEGTAIENATSWDSSSGFGKYLDSLHNNPRK